MAAQATVCYSTSPGQLHKAPVTSYRKNPTPLINNNVPLWANFLSKGPNAELNATIAQQQDTFNTNSFLVSARTQIQIKREGQLAKGGQKKKGEERVNTKGIWRPHKEKAEE